MKAYMVYILYNHFAITKTEPKIVYLPAKFSFSVVSQSRLGIQVYHAFPVLNHDPTDHN